MQEYKLIDKFDGYKLLDRNGQVIYVQTDDVKKQLSLGNVRIYGLKLSESGRLLKETPEEIKEQQRQQQEQIKQQQLLEKQKQEQRRAEQQRQREEQKRQKEEHVRQLKANLQWDGTLFGVPLDEFKAEFGGRSYGRYYEDLLLTEIKYGVPYEDRTMFNAVCKISNFDEYENGLIWVYDPDKKEFIQTEYYIALANKMWHDNSLRVNKKSRESVVKRVEEIGDIAGQFRLDLQWNGTLFGVPLNEFRAEFGGRSYGPYGTGGPESMEYIENAEHEEGFEDRDIRAKVKINNCYRDNGQIRVFDEKQGKYIKTEYYIAFANSLYSRLNDKSSSIYNKINDKSKRQFVVNMLNKMGREIDRPFKLRQYDNY